ncbi:hypothetical protein LXL04_011603 [Taraxacum kok-saghyz]
MLIMNRSYNSTIPPKLQNTPILMAHCIDFHLYPTNHVLRTQYQKKPHSILLVMLGICSRIALIIPHSQKTKDQLRNYAKQMMKYVSANPDRTTLTIILQFRRLNFYMGRPYVNNTFRASKLFINDDIYKILSFKTK